jgi:hypothetical protein
MATISAADREYWGLVDIPPVGQTTAIACPGAALLQVDCWERTPEADQLRHVRIYDCSLGLGAAARALSIDVVTMGAIERAQVRPRDPRLFAEMARRLREWVSPPAIPDGI